MVEGVTLWFVIIFVIGLILYLLKSVFSGFLGARGVCPAWQDVVIRMSDRYHSFDIGGSASCLVYFLRTVLVSVQ